MSNIFLLLIEICIKIRLFYCYTFFFTKIHHFSSSSYVRKIWKNQSVYSYFMVFVHGLLFICRICFNLNKEFSFCTRQCNKCVIDVQTTVAEKLVSLMKKRASGKILLLENECKTPYGCLTFTFYQKFFL